MDNQQLSNVATQVMEKSMWSSIYITMICEKDMSPEQASRLADESMMIYNLRWSEGATQ